MKYLSLFLCVGILLFSSCGGDDEELLQCSFWITFSSVTGYEPDNSCQVRYLFLDESNNEFSFDSEATAHTLIQLPKNRCYRAWAYEIGNDGEACGNFTYTIMGPDKEECFSFSVLLEGRPDLIDLEKPEYSFCLGEDCACPEIN